MAWTDKLPTSTGDRRISERIQPYHPPGNSWVCVAAEAKPSRMEEALAIRIVDELW